MVKRLFKYRMRHITPLSSRVYKHFYHKYEVDNHLYQLVKGYCGSAVTEYDIQTFGKTLYSLEKWNDTYRKWDRVCYIKSMDGKTWESYKE